MRHDADIGLMQEHVRPPDFARLQGPHHALFVQSVMRQLGQYCAFDHCAGRNNYLAGNLKIEPRFPSLWPLLRF